MPGTTHMPLSSIFTATLQSGCPYTHFTDERTEAPRGNVTCLPTVTVSDSASLPSKHSQAPNPLHQQFQVSQCSLRQQ